MIAMADKKNLTAAQRALRTRNLALGLVLGFLAILFFVMTIVRLGEQVGH